MLYKKLIGEEISVDLPSQLSLSTNDLCSMLQIALQAHFFDHKSDKWTYWLSESLLYRGSDFV